MCPLRSSLELDPLFPSSVLPETPDLLWQGLGFNLMQCTLLSPLKEVGFVTEFASLQLL